MDGTHSGSKHRAAGSGKAVKGKAEPKPAKKSLIDNAKEVAHTDADAIVKASKDIGEEYWGKMGAREGLIWHDPNEMGWKVGVVSFQDRLKELARDYELDPDDPETEYDVQMIDDFEYVFEWNSVSKTAKRSSLYWTEREDMRPSQVKAFYDNAKPGEYLVSYWTEAPIKVIIP